MTRLLGQFFISYFKSLPQTFWEAFYVMYSTEVSISCKFNLHVKYLKGAIAWHHTKSQLDVDSK